MKRRYYAKTETGKADEKPLAAIHSEFLRTGRISRRKEDWLPDEKRYLTYAEVAQATARKLEAAGEKTHQKINGFHRSIQFPKLIFHKTLENSPHLGYCHVTASRTSFAKYADVKWSFYIANFFSEIGDEDSFFKKIEPRYSRMYFAVALQPDKAAKALSIDRTFRSHGLLFRTRDPMEALKNVLKLGARTQELRDAIDRL